MTCEFDAFCHSGPELTTAPWLRPSLLYLSVSSSCSRMHPRSDVTEASVATCGALIVRRQERPHRMTPIEAVAVSSHLSSDAPRLPKPKRTRVAHQQRRQLNCSASASENSTVQSARAQSLTRKVVTRHARKLPHRSYLRFVHWGPKRIRIGTIRPRQLTVCTYPDPGRSRVE